MKKVSAPVMPSPHAVANQDARLSKRLRMAPTRYVPRDRVAFGGMAEVWRADAVFENGEKYPVAIKRVLAELAMDDKYRSMFEDEARLGMLLRHPNVVRVFDAREVQGNLLMVMELVNGTSLKGMMEPSQRTGKPLPMAVTLFMIRELAKGLDYAHRAKDEAGNHLGIIHRDVSPHNVLLGDNGAVKLADFGLANANVHKTLQEQGVVGGKFGYLAPELLYDGSGDHRLDLFAVGIVLWEALVGRRLFRQDDDSKTVRAVLEQRIETPSSQRADVPPAVDQIVMSLLDRKPSGRPKSGVHLVRMVDEALAHIDPAVGSRDVALMVCLHTASKVDKGPSATQALMSLEQELDEFVKLGEDAAGQEPLDPSDFGKKRRP